MDELTQNTDGAEQAAAAAQRGAADVGSGLMAEVDKGKEWLERLQAWVVENGAEFLVTLIVVLLILLVGKIVITMVSAALQRRLEKSDRVDGILEEFIPSVVRKVLWIIVFMMALGRFGIDIGPMIAGLGVLGFVVGFAFQESLGNLAAGVMLALNKPFKVGDYVEAGGCTATVAAMDMMATTMTSPDNKKIVVPNKSVWGSAITNYTALDTRRVECGVGVSYGADLNKTRQTILEVIKKHELCLDEPAPMVEVVEMGDSSVNFCVRPWCKTEDYWTLFFQLNQQVKEALDAAGIEIPFPQRDVHVYGLEKVPSGQ
jgi:small conductance mechanosensitive channel